MKAPRVFLQGRVVSHGGDCREILRALPANSVDSIVTDPPYHLAGSVDEDDLPLFAQGAD